MLFDFFITHASQDRQIAEDLYDRLAGLGARCFLDSRSLRFGDDWDLALPKAQSESRATIILVSAKCDQAFYQREEIATAISLSRTSPETHRVIPVFLEDLAPEMIPYGLRVKHGLYIATEPDLKSVASRIMQSLIAAMASPPDSLKDLPSFDGTGIHKGRRLLVAIATARYEKNPDWNRPGLGETRQQVIDLFTDVLGYAHVPNLGLNPTASQLTRRLRALCKNRVRPEDYLVVYLAGHSEILGDGRHVLLAADTGPDDVANALSTVDLVSTILRGTPVQKLLLLLDTRYSGGDGKGYAASVLASMQRDWASPDRSGLAVVISTQPFQQAGSDAFATLLRQAVIGRPTAGQLPASLALGAVVEAMNDNPMRPRRQEIGWTTFGLTVELPDFLPNPRHRSGMTDIDLHMQQVAEWRSYAERRETEFRRRFLIHAMGGHGPEATWWFSGRHAALTDIVTWLSGPAESGTALVVVAGPGSGKTAVLGLISALTDREHRRTVPLDALAFPPEAVPPIGAVDVSIYAGGLTHEQVLAGLAAAAHVRAATVGELVEALRLQSSTGGTRPFTAIIDALDEAADPHQLITQILCPIIDEGRVIRLLLGTRPHVLELLTQTTPTDSRSRVAALELDEPRYFDSEALTAYTLRCLLEATTDSPYLHVLPQRAREVAEAVAATANPSFLVARVTAATLAAASNVVDPADALWRASLPRLPGDAMQADLDTRLGDHADRARDLLRPLAYAEGQGIPWENIWAPLASKISGRPYSDDDLFWLREHAGSYVVEATEENRSAYRLYHQALSEYLRDCSRSSGITDLTIHHAFDDVLTRIPRAADGTRDWTRAHPYATRHLATHAAAAGTLDALLNDAEYLVHADPDTLLPALHAVRAADGQLAATVYRASSHLHRHCDTAARRQILAIDAARCGTRQLSARLSEQMAIKPRWATGVLISTALRTVLTGHAFPVRTVVCDQIDGTPVAITAGGAARWGEAIVWNLRTGEQEASLSGHGGPVNAVACTRVDDIPLAITAADGGLGARELMMWDLRTGSRHGAPIEYQLPIRALACTWVDDMPVIVTAAHDVLGTAEVTVWDLRTGSRHAILTGHAGAVQAVACTYLASTPVAVTASGSGEVFVWDLRTCEVRMILTKRGAPVNAVACSQVDGVPVAVTSGGDLLGGSEVLVWDLRTGRQRNALAGHTGSANTVACIEVDGIPLAVTGAGGFRRYGEVLVWNLRTGKQHATLTGHAQPLQALASAHVDSTPIAIAATGNVIGGGEVLLWDLRTCELQSSPRGHTMPVFAVACTELDGLPLAITVGGEGLNPGEVLIWNLCTGDLRASVRGQRWHTGDLKASLRWRWHAVACTWRDGNPLAVSAGGFVDPGELLVWDLRTGALAATLTGHTALVRAVACTESDGIPLAVTVGGDYSDPGELLVWDLRTGALKASLAGHSGLVRAVACTRRDGIPLAITVGGSAGKGEVLAWDLQAGVLQSTLTDHTMPMQAVACTERDGIPLVITAGHHGDCGQVLAWDLRDNLAVGSITMPYPVSALAVGPFNEVIIGLAHEVVVLDLAFGTTAEQNSK